MYCNKVKHDELDDIVCPFCCKQIKEQSVKNIECCDEHCQGNRDHEIICINCEQIDGYDPIQEFCSFHDNKHKMVKKLKYYRKYPLDKIIFNLTKKYDIMITTNNSL